MAGKSASEKEADSANSRYIIMCLGLLIGFVVGFVLLLSSLPVDDALTDYRTYISASKVNPEGKRYDFYQMLPDRDVRPDPEPITRIRPPATEVQVAARETRVEPVTRVVPANAQIASPTAFTEVPANYNTQQSYYLQAGKFRHHEDAQAMRAQVLLLGLEAFIVTREEADGATAHRVRVGPYYDQSILTEAKKRLSRGRITYEIVRVTG